MTTKFISADEVRRLDNIDFMYNDKFVEGWVDSFNPKYIRVGNELTRKKDVVIVTNTKKYERGLMSKIREIPKF